MDGRTNRPPRYPLRRGDGRTVQASVPNGERCQNCGQELVVHLRPGQPCPACGWLVAEPEPAAMPGPGPAPPTSRAVTPARPPACRRRSQDGAPPLAAQALPGAPAAAGEPAFGYVKLSAAWYGAARFRSDTGSLTEEFTVAYFYPDGSSRGTLVISFHELRCGRPADCRVVAWDDSWQLLADDRVRTILADLSRFAGRTVAPADVERVLVQAGARDLTPRQAPDYLAGLEGGCRPSA